MIQKEEITSVQINKLKELKNLLQLIEQNSFEKIREGAVDIFYNNYDLISIYY